MRDTKAPQRTSFVTIVLLSLLATALFFVLFSTPDYTPAQKLHRVAPWYIGQTETELPLQADKTTGATHRITAVLPVLSHADCLIFHTENLRVSVSVGDVVLYETPAIPPHTTLGDEWHLVFLPMESSGKTVAIDSTVLYPAASQFINAVYIGSRADFLREMLSRKLASYLVSLLIVLMGVTYLFTGRPVSRRLNVRAPVSLSLLFILLGLWSATQTEVPDLLYGKTVLSQLLSYATLPFSAAMVAFFLCTLPAPRWLKVVYRCIGYAQLVIGVLAIAGETFHFAAYAEILPHLWYCTLALILLFLIQLPSLVKEYQTHSYMMLGLVCLAGTIVMDVVSVHVGTYDYGRNTRFGLLWLSLLLSVQYWRQMRESIKLADEAEVMRRLAYQDTLTGLYNRLALVSDQEALLSRHEGCVGIVQMDINNLKPINDQFGHEEGDALILRAAKAIRQAFGEVGTCYRIGGDEFVALITKNACEATYQTCAKRLAEACEQQNRGQTHPLSVALGFAVYEPSMGDRFYDLVRIADLRMYQQKRRMKSMLADDGGEKARFEAGIPELDGPETTACPLPQKPARDKRKRAKADQKAASQKSGNRHPHGRQQG